MAIPNMKSYTNACARPMIKALETLYAADTIYIQNLVAEQNRLLVVATREMTALREAVTQLQADNESYREEVYMLKRQIFSNEYMEQLGAIFSKLIEHNRRLFDVEHNKATQTTTNAILKAEDKKHLNQKHLSMLNTRLSIALANIQNIQDQINALKEETEQTPTTE